MLNKFFIILWVVRFLHNLSQIINRYRILNHHLELLEKRSISAILWKPLHSWPVSKRISLQFPSINFEMCRRVNYSVPSKTLNFRYERHLKRPERRKIHQHTSIIGRVRVCRFARLSTIATRFSRLVSFQVVRSCVPRVCLSLLSIVKIE